MTLTRRYATCVYCKSDLIAPDNFEFTADTVVCDKCWEVKFGEEQRALDKWDEEHRYDDVTCEGFEK
jgi:hypothetical protein